MIPSAAPIREKSAGSWRERSLRAELARLESSLPLAGATKLRQLLRYLFEETLAGRGSLISQYRIAFDCYGIGEAFDTSVNTLVRANAKRLRKILADLAPAEGECTIRMARRGYCLLLACAEDPSSLTVLSRRPSLGVLDFDITGLPSADLGFSRMVSEEIMLALNVQDLVEPQGPLAFTQRQISDEGATELLRGLKLDFLIAGGVSEQDGTIVFHLRLLDGCSGSQLWATRGGLEQETVSGNLARNLARAIVPLVTNDWGPIGSHISKTVRSQPREQISAYEAVILARQYLTHYQFEDLPLIVRTLREACVKTQDVAVPASLAMLLNAACGCEPRWREPLDRNEIRQLAAQAARLDPEDPWSRFSLAISAMLDGRRTVLVEMARRTAREPESQLLLLGGMGALLYNQALELELGREMLERYCRQTTDYPRVVHLSLALGALANGDLAETRAELARFGVSWGWAAPLVLAACAALEGDREQAEMEWRRVLEAFPDFPSRWRDTIATQWHASYLEQIFGALRSAGIHLD
jgi:TolB-like protein